MFEDLATQTRFFAAATKIYYDAGRRTDSWARTHLSLVKR